jgi:hypothetical protein
MENPLKSKSLFGICTQHNASFFAKKIIKIEFVMKKIEIDKRDKLC